MTQDQHLDLDVERVAAALQMSIGLLRRRLRQVQVSGELSPPEISALSRLDRGGPATAAALARLEQITPQSMGTTLSALEAQGLVARKADPEDGRRVILSLTETGVEAVRDRRTARTTQLAEVLATEFNGSELKALMAAAPLIERLAESL